MKLEFVCYGDPIGKPRMTRRDKWKKRTCVVAYREWCDRLREAAGIHRKVILTSATVLVVKAYFGLPQSWSARKKMGLIIKPHIQRPDCDNVLKAVADALFENDELVFSMSCEKAWQDSNGPRIHVRVVNL